MGVKFLSFQMIPWCFHLMGNHVSCLQFHSDPEPAPPVVGTIKLIKSDGVVKTYHRPIPVSELMLEFPKHLVCRSDSFYIGQKIPALSEDEQLQIGHKYFLLPNHFFQTVLSFVTVASFAASASQLPSSGKNAFLKKAATCQPFDIQKTPSGCLRIRVSDEFISQLMEEGRRTEPAEEEEEEESCSKSKLCTTAQLRKDYTRLVGCRQWKPKLETIRETEKKKRKLGASFRRKSKGTLKAVHHHHHHQHQRSSSSSSSSHEQQQQQQQQHSHSKSKIKSKTRK